MSKHVADASKESADYCLSRGKSFAVVVGKRICFYPVFLTKFNLLLSNCFAGGAREALKAQPKSMNLTLNTRKGFIRLALRHGASVIPAISFGENDVFRTVSISLSLGHFSVQFTHHE